MAAAAGRSEGSDEYSGNWETNRPMKTEWGREAGCGEGEGGGGGEEEEKKKRRLK